MKKEKENETRATSPDRLILKLASGDPIQNGQWIQSQSAGTRSPFLRRVYPSCGADYAKAFVSLQGQGSGFTIGKGPPGLSPVPGGGAGRDPDNKAGPPTGKAQSKNTLQSNNTVLSINKKQNSNFLQTLIFTIMKKQILILVLIVMATFAGVNNSYGQYDPQLSVAPTYVPLATPIGAACATADALHPIPGTLYPYTVTVSNGGTAPTIHWFVTANPNFIVDNASTGGGTLTSAFETTPSSAYLQATGATYNTPANTTASVDITWKYFPSSVDVFLVAYIKGDPTCTDNIQVYKIQPSHAFTLDMANLTAAGLVNATSSDCVSPIVDAKFVSPNLVMDYGVNYVYFTVNAANFSHSWLPSFDVTASNMTATAPAVGDGTLAVHWAYPLESTGVGAVWHPTTAAVSVYTSAITDPVKPISATATGVGATGESIIVRVTVDHNKNETLNDIALTLAANGVMYDFATTGYATATLGDLHTTSGLGNVPPCPWVDGFTNDKTTYTLRRRATIVDAIPNVPVVTDFIPKN